MPQHSYLSLPRGLRPGAGRSPVPLSAADLAVVNAAFAARGADSPWCGFASLEQRASDLMLFVQGRHARVFTLTRYGDDCLELAAADGRVLHRASSVAVLLAPLAGGLPLH